jgi:hypothetical protein
VGISCIWRCEGNSHHSEFSFDNSVATSSIPLSSNNPTLLSISPSHSIRSSTSTSLVTSPTSIDGALSPTTSSDQQGPHTNVVSKSTPPGVIVGAVLGSLAFICIVISSLLIYRGHRRRPQTTPENGIARGAGHIEPFITDGYHQNHMVNRDQAKRWHIASDSKPKLSEANKPPPAYE